MVNIDNIINVLDSEFEIEIKRHDYHKKRVRRAIEWFNKNAIDNSQEFIASGEVRVNGVIAMCMEYSFTGAPVFECHFIFMPYNSNDDCGSGVGMQHKVEF